MAKYRKRPVVIDAIQLPSEDSDVSSKFIKTLHEFLHGCQWSSDRDAGIAIRTLEGDMRADPGDWIIKGVKGEFYPCKPDIFAATYDPVNPDQN